MKNTIKDISDRVNNLNLNKNLLNKVFNNIILKAKNGEYKLKSLYITGDVKTVLEALSYKVLESNVLDEQSNYKYSIITWN